MPKRRQGAGEQAGLPVEVYRHPEAARPNKPPAVCSAAGRIPKVAPMRYAYSPRLDPSLRSDASDRADALPAVLEKATREVLSREEAGLLAEALRRHEPWLAWAGKWEASVYNCRIHCC